jgi:2-dehydro-3-deoxygluconokinase
MYDIVTVGEGMLRLSPPRYERIQRARTFDVHVCGSQGNIACNTARLGLKTAFVTKVPDNDLGLLMRDHYMSHGVDVSYIDVVEDCRVWGDPACEQGDLRPGAKRRQHDQV